MTALPHSEPYRTRLDVLFAARSPKAVLLRRGPKRHFRLISWDLTTHTFTPGQWMKGVIRLCDLSPSGDKLLYFAAQYHRPLRFRAQNQTFDPAIPHRTLRPKNKRKLPRYLQAAAAPVGWVRRPSDTWTALSIQPYFTALAHWPALGTWTGGGVFKSDRGVALRETGDSLRPQSRHPLPSTFSISELTPADIVSRRTLRNAHHPSDELADVAETLRAMLQKAGFGLIDWVSTHREPDLLFAAEGRLYRLERWKAVGENRYAEAVRLLADFRDMAFEQLPPPPDVQLWQ